MPHVTTVSGVVLATLSLLAPSGVVHAEPCWPPPVVAPVSDPFREPACAWCPGNRGIEFGTSRGASVRAVATGRVTFAGIVTGTVYVIVRHGSGHRVTYGNLESESYDVGDLIVRGQLVGRAAGAFHLGLRDGDRYVDPGPYLGRYVRRPRLIPADGSRSNPPPPPRLTCSVERGSR
jgi:murein DD-endopeptidase MepM/ murein hydrolase activator NlpD